MAATHPFGEDKTVVRSSPASGRTPKTGPIPTAPKTGPTPTAPKTGPTPEDPNQAWEATVARDVLVGQQLDGYVVKRRIGEGGMGIVYEGEHPIIGRKVAIKILRPTEGVQARDLIAEAKAASAIRHRGIIDVFGFGTIPHIGQYLVMEFLEGTPLNKVIAQRAPMPELEVIALMDELLAALSAAHAVGVIHRDLKPGNIFVERDSSGAELVKVLDFGLAKRSEVPNGSTPQTRASLIVGTPEYIAPEQATGQSVGPHTDLYAAGLIAFEMLTRRLPFEGNSAMALIIQHVQKEPPAPSSFVDVHPALDALVLRMLAKEPSQRPASAEETRRELKRILQQISQGEAVAPSSTPKAAHPHAEELSPTLVRPTPRAPLSTSRVRSAPASGARSRGGMPSVEVEPDVGETTAEIQKAALPPNRRGLLGAAAAAAVVLAGLGGWMMRGAAPVQPATAQAVPAPAPPQPSAVAPVAAQAPASPQPAVLPTPEGKEPHDAAGTPPEPQPAGDAETTAAAQKAAGKKGVLHLVVRGSGTIRVDGKIVGEVPPLNTLSLPEGEHKLEVLNPSAYPYQTTITITAGQRITHRVKLRPIKGTVGTP